MTALQKIQLRQSEIRSKIAAELERAPEDRTEGELERLTAEAQTVEIELRAALVIEQDQGLPEDSAEAPEDHQLAELRNRVDFGNYVRAAMAGGGVLAGAEAEYNQELGLREDFFPLEILADGAELETRAARDGDAQGNQQTWLDRVFAVSAAMRLGINMRSVSPGVTAYPVTTVGGSGAQRGRTEAATESTYTVVVSELKPTRNSIHGIYSIEDDLRLPGLGDAIRRDMSMAMMESIDRAVFVGDAGANENGADITGLTTAAIAETELTQANKAAGANVLAAFVNLIDGQYAAMLSDLNVVAAVGAYRLWESTSFNSTAENETVASFLRESGLSMMSRGGIETGTADGDFGAFVGLARGIEGAAVCPIWNQGQLIRDPYSNASQGEVKLTLSYYWNFGIPRPANFKRIKFVT